MSHIFTTIAGTRRTGPSCGSVNATKGFPVEPLARPRAVNWAGLDPSTDDLKAITGDRVQDWTGLAGQTQFE